jgi:hypothetical protein
MNTSMLLFATLLSMLASPALGFNMEVAAGSSLTFDAQAAIS